ncbi:MAG: cache domain-containing sensor histidine kinase [Cellulosilyticaceae bacterium]
MKRQKRCDKLQSKLMRYFFSLLLFIVCVFDLFFIYKLSAAVEKDAHIYSYEIVKQLGKNIESYISHMREIMWLISNQEVDLMAQLQEELDQPTVKRNYFLEGMRSRGNSANEITAINIFGKNGLILTNGYPEHVKPYIDVTQMDWYIKAVEAKGRPVITGSHVQNYLKDEGKWVFSLSSAIMSKGEVLGVVLVDMSYKNLTDICHEIQLGEQGYVYIVSADSEIIYHPKQQLIYSGIMTEDIDRVMMHKEESFSEEVGGKRLITAHQLGTVDWVIVGVSYIDELLVSKDEMIVSLVILTGSCLVVALFISKRMAREIARPIMELENSMYQVQGGNLEIKALEDCDTEEIQSLVQSFNHMIHKIQGLIETIEENQKKLRKSELRVLQSQINPHFLYNSLDTIIWLGEREECEKVVQMTAALARYFRLSLSKGREVVSIYDELQHLKHYLEIQKIRYSNKLTYTIDVDPEIYEYMIVKIVLQPLVENALYHGIKDLDKGGVIEVTGYKADNHIYLEVYDNGKGMTQEQIASILTAPLSHGITKGGVAIKNIHERIQIYFGVDYGVRYESAYGKWTKACIKIPAIEVGGLDGKKE